MGRFRKRRPNVEKLKRRHDVGGLVIAAGFSDRIIDRDDHVVDLAVGLRREAVTALGGENDPAAREAIRGALSDPSEEVRLAALEAVRQDHDSAAIPAVIAAVLSPGGREREAVFREGCRVLVGLSEPDTAEVYARSLVASARETSSDSTEARLLSALLDGAAAGFERRFLDGLFAAMGAPDLDSPGRASRLLAHVGPLAVPRALEALEDPRTRITAASLLGALRDTRAVEPLIGAAADPQPLVRRAAVRALGEIKDPRAVESLAAAARDDDYETRAAAIEALNEFGAIAVIYSVGALVRPLLRLVSPRSAGEAPAPALSPSPSPSRATAAPITAGRALRRLLKRSAG